MSSNAPEGMVPCDEVLQCINPDPCPTCAENDPSFTGSVAGLVKGRFYRAKARTPDGAAEVPAWWIPELDPKPHVMRCGCGLHFGLSWVLRCNIHFGKIDEEHIPDVLARIKGCKAGGPQVRKPELEDA